ncbi:amino acid/amide ABC transporter substrate-binding protein (HAAT family) [Murinocardiopsis flavida]|uniref:Amino acid/amide ABC transporter substrate-binding protein (HAAT family) n=1 Tax=Murinocardiopsis flavida TaxID=645275 RepID=A0A2P8DLR0_9ACTN|nr:ABC transporter substrate-binding protein [Murinocardiopsis flavida]PSK98135.1 amino acid/amide ABC transporter substrate-binding protein (HAAT family) [Murinocardiopsis flavida]
MSPRTPVLAIGLTLALLATACGGAGEVEEGRTADLDVATGVTDDTVRIGTHQPLTGPAAPGYAQISAGAKAVFEYVNENGGVNGRRIEYLVEDDGYDPVRTIDVTRELVASDEIFAMLGGLGTPTHSKVVDYLNKEGVPDLFVSSGALMWNAPEKSPLTYGYQVDYTKEAKIQGEFIADEFPDEKIGFFYQNDDVGEDSRAGLERYLGDEIVEEQRYESGVTEIGPQIAALKKAGADVVVCACIPTYVALAIVESERIGYRPQFVVSSIGADTETLKGLLTEFTDGAGEDAVEELLDGLIATAYLPQVGMAEDPWIGLYRKIHEDHNKDGAFTNTTVYGMVQATLFAQVLKEAGRDLTRQSLLDALESREWAGPGLVPFAASKDDHGGFAGAMVTRFHAGGEPETLREPKVTDREGGAISGFELERPDPGETEFFDGG